MCCQTDSLLSGVLALRQQCQQKEEGLRGCDLGLHSETDKKKKKNSNNNLSKKAVFSDPKTEIPGKADYGKMEIYQTICSAEIKLKRHHEALLVEIN